MVEAEVRYPTDLGLCADATRSLAAEAARARPLAGDDAPRVVDRTRAVRRRLRTLSRTLARRSGQGAAVALALTGEGGAIARRSIREARRLADALRARARGQGAGAKLAAAARLERLAGRAATVAEQIDKRIAESTRRGARGLVLPASTRVGAPAESDLLPQTGAEVARLGLRPAEVALDGGFLPRGVAEQLPGVRRAFIAGRQGVGSRRTNRRLARYRVGIEGRISHLKRRYGLRRSRLRGHAGLRTWVAWAVLAYTLDTLAIRGA